MAPSYVDRGINILYVKLKKCVTPDVGGARL